MGVKLIAAGMLLWGLGYGLHSFMLPVHLRSIGCTPEQVGLVFSAGMAAMALSALPGGWLADRFERRRVIRISWLAGAPSALLYYLARDHRLAAVGMALYFGAQAGYPALNAYVASAAGVGRSGSTFGIVNAAFAGGMVAGPMRGGWIAGRWSATRCSSCRLRCFWQPRQLCTFCQLKGRWTAARSRRILRRLRAPSRDTWSFFGIRSL